VFVFVEAYFKLWLLLWSSDIEKSIPGIETFCMMALHFTPHGWMSLCAMDLVQLQRSTLDHKQ